MNIAAAAGEHLLLVLLAVGFAALFGLPGAVWAFRNPAPGNYLLRAADLVQTIPSLALFGLLLPLPLIGESGHASPSLPYSPTLYCRFCATRPPAWQVWPQSQA